MESTRSKISSMEELKLRQRKLIENVKKVEKELENAQKGLETAQKGLERAKKDVDNASKDLEKAKQNYNQQLQELKETEESLPKTEAADVAVATVSPTVTLHYFRRVDVSNEKSTHEKKKVGKGIKKEGNEPEKLPSKKSEQNPSLSKKEE